MEVFASPIIPRGSIQQITFSLASAEEIRSSCANEDPIAHAHQLGSPYLGLPSDFGICEACGTYEQAECGGHFGQIVLPCPVYHPHHVHELKDMLNLICLKCLRMKKREEGHSVEVKKHGSPCLYCPELPAIRVSTVNIDGAIGLELKTVSRKEVPEGFWNFLKKYGFRYSESDQRSLLPYESLNILKEIPEPTVKKLSKKGFYPQKGFIMLSLPVPPNYLRLTDYFEGKNTVSSDLSLSALRRILKKVEEIRKSRTGSPNFECCKFESNELQAAILTYMHVRGTAKKPQTSSKKIEQSEASGASTKRWLEKIRTLFFRKSSNFSSRSIITGDAYIAVNSIGLPSEIAKKITIEERVTSHNMRWLQNIVDGDQCVMFRDGKFSYEFAPGSTNRPYLKVGQIVHRQIMDGDVVFINRPPSTHAHSIQALSVYLHDDVVVKINPQICAPFGADFDGDCVHVFYPQSFLSKSEAMELYSAEQQFCSTHNGSLNVQLSPDLLLALRMMRKKYFLKKAMAQQLAMFSNPTLPFPALYKSSEEGSLWTAAQLLQGALPLCLDCCGRNHRIRKGEIMALAFKGDSLKSTMTEVITSILRSEGPNQVLNFFNLVQGYLMEFISLQCFSISLHDFYISKDVRDCLRRDIEQIFRLFNQLRKNCDEIIYSRINSQLKYLKNPIINFIAKNSSLGFLVDLKNEAAVSKLVQQLGFVGLQLSDRGKFYSPEIVEDIYTHFSNKYQLDDFHCPTKGYGMIGSSFFEGLDPFEFFIHSIKSREQIIHSSGGLIEPGTLFKNLMSILRDVVLVYDGTVRNLCSNSVIMFNYGHNPHASAGTPVGALAATAISSPAYKAVHDSSPSIQSSWEMMKEVLFSRVQFKNDDASRRVILYMEDCMCGGSYCQERAASTVCSFLKKVSLREFAVDFSIEYQNQMTLPQKNEVFAGLVAHIHLDELKLDGLGCMLEDICGKCAEALHSYGKKRKGLFQRLKKILLYSSECCQWDPLKGCRQSSSSSPCIRFLYHDPDTHYDDLKDIIDMMTQVVCRVLLEVVIKGDPRVHSTKIIWISPEAMYKVGSRIKNPRGELAVEITIEKTIAKKHGDAWNVAQDCCLPIMHLIDTRRSAPYGIQQIQDYLGISAGFNQSFQRLSKSVGQASKGVYKEHLLLVTQCLTYSGKINGFHTAGFKSLFHSLSVQVPFTEATLHTPLKCFERAAEKCHVEPLTSVVAGCSWGKQVAIGTGQFDILWDRKKMAEVDLVESDMYGFLSMVKEVSGHREKGSALLGVDVDLLPERDGPPSPICDASLWEFDFANDVDSDNQNSALKCGDRSARWEDQVKETEEKSKDWGVHGVGQESNHSRKQIVWGDRDQNEGESNYSGNQTVWGNRDQNEGESNYSGNQTLWGDRDRNEGESDYSGNQTLWGDRDRNEGESDYSGNQTAWGDGDQKHRIQTHWADRMEVEEIIPEWEVNAVDQNSNFLGSETSPTRWEEGNNKGAMVAVDQPARNEWTERQSPSEINESEWSQSQSQPLSRTDGRQENGIYDGRDQLNSSDLSLTPLGWEEHRSQGDRMDVNPSDGSEWRESQSQPLLRASGRPEKRVYNHRGRLDSSDLRLTPIGRSRDPPRNRDLPLRTPFRFTPDEEAILVDIEPVMQQIRKILRLSGYNLGDRLSAEHQAYVMDNALCYHPNRSSKVNGEVDHILIDEPEGFPNTRCFFAVSTDGTKVDFSFLKCMENFVRQRYPETAEPFCNKFFKHCRISASQGLSQGLPLSLPPP